MNVAGGYLDWNASAPLRSEARKAMLAAMEVVGNPSSVHAGGRAARAVVEKARMQVANALGADPENIVFTSGATESAALSLAGRDVMSAPIEHESVLAWTNPMLPADRNGQVSVASPSESTLQVANGETGILQDLPERIFATDATQAFGKVPIAEQVRKADRAFVSAHKAGGPKGVGALVLRPGVEFAPQMKGGGQELGRRSGTENTIGIAGFGAAAEAAAAEVANGVWEEVGEVRDLLEDMLAEANDAVIFVGKEADRLPNTTCFAVPGWKGETQVIQMDLEGFSISAGSACSSGKVRASRTLDAMGMSGALAQSAVRVSIGPSTTEQLAADFAKAWLKQLDRTRPRAAGAVPPVSARLEKRESMEVGV